MNLLILFIICTIFSSILVDNRKIHNYKTDWKPEALRAFTNTRFRGNVTQNSWFPQLSDKDSAIFTKKSRLKLSLHESYMMKDMRIPNSRRWNKSLQIVSLERKRRSAEDPCGKFGTCDYVSQIPVHTRHCHCDDNCVKYDDCCPEANRTATKKQENTPQYKCSNNGTAKQMFGAFVIDTCLPMYEKTKTKVMCSLEDVRFGGWVADKQGQIYHNQFCAKCNNISSFVFFRVIISNIIELETSNLVNKSQQLKLKLKDKGKVVVQYKTPPGITPRPCLTIVKGKKPSERCTSYGTNPVVTKDGMYRNFFCSNENLNSECIDQMSDSDQLYDLFPMTVMFVFSQPGKNAKCIDVEDGTCYGAEVYNNYEVVATFRAMVTGDNSVSILQNYVISFCLSLQVENFSFVFKLNSFVSLIEENTGLLIIARIRLLESLYLADVLRYETLIRNVKRKIVSGREREDDFVIVDFEKSDTELQVKESLKESIEWRNLLIWSERYKDLEEFLINASLSKNLFVRDSLCQNMLINIQLEINQNLSVSGTTCLSDRSGTPNLINFAKVVTTYSGFSLSIISLVSFIILNRRLGNHNAVAGANLENLSIALLLSVVLFVVGIGLNDYFIACKVMSVALHYAWLTVFSFKSIAVIGIISKLWDHEVNKAKYITTTKRVFFRIFGLLLPIVFVVPLVVLTETGIVPYYNKEHQGICFPTAYPTNLIFVSGPIMLSIVINTICLVLFIIHIRRVKVMSTRLTMTKSFNEALVYLRFSLFSGTPWIIGVLSAFVKTDFLDFVFIVLCSLQGFFIVISNVTSENMRHHFATIIKKKKGPTHSNQVNENKLKCYDCSQK